MKRSSKTAVLVTTLHKWKTFLKKITSETLGHLDDASLPADASIERMFDDAKSHDSSITSYRNVSEMKLTDESTTITSGGAAATSNMSDTAANVMDFGSFDAVKECQTLRQQLRDDTPFHHAEQIWLKRRKLWQMQDNSVNQQQLEDKRAAFQKIPKDYYPQIYTKLVVDDKPLKEPLNLEDAIQIINAGWVEDKKWVNNPKRHP